ncbi:hypothetical protein NAT51_13575 [Flavobacterium amniphilum]|uniref:hypothetical protein n=1 Tax=Flavobacterium amniphilum TaxID=1834035 RepID=UPI002029F31A|nr:hypothetical protein [Flavobacterium amniphilum]MCL9806560.1 hypothetical protein [Flavobacterium amniphilum]
MKKLLISFLVILSYNCFAQTPTETTIHNMADFNCQCQDTITLNKERVAILNNMKDCFTKSMVTYLNKGELTNDYLTDPKKMNALQKKVFNQLAGCEKTIEIFQKLNVIPTPADTVPEVLFLSENFLGKHGFKKGQVEKEFRVWNSEKNKKIQRLVDIRWVFTTHEEALRYHTTMLGRNAEGGPEINFNGKLEGAAELHVFKEGPQAEMLMKSLNVSQRQHYFIFVVDNVVFKIFASTEIAVNPEDITFIPEEAIKIFKAYKQKQ